MLLYVIPMYWASFKSYFMMSAFTPEGQLQYQFIDIVQTIVPFYVLYSYFIYDSALKEAGL